MFTSNNMKTFSFKNNLGEKRIAKIFSTIKQTKDYSDYRVRVGKIAGLVTMRVWSDGLKEIIAMRQPMKIYKTKKGHIAVLHSSKDFILKVFRNEKQLKEWQDSLKKNNPMLSFYKIPMMIERYDAWNDKDIDAVDFR